MRFQNLILDRIWLTVIAVAFVLWILFTIDRLGWPVTALIFGLVLRWSLRD